MYSLYINGPIEFQVDVINRLFGKWGEHRDGPIS
jgi:hypothetical protein